MSDPKKNIFKLQCTNPECNKVYYSEDLIDVADLWGFIFLTDGEEYIIGLTCVACQHTVIQNYKILPEDFPFNSKKMDDARWGSLGLYVPFSPEIAETFNQVPIPREKRPDSKKSFSIPGAFQPIIDYPEGFEASFLPIKIHEEDVGTLCEYENCSKPHKLKVFPRIVTQNSVYRISDVMMSGMIGDEIFELCENYEFNEDYEFDSDDIGKFFVDTKNALVSLVTNGFQLKHDSQRQSSAIKYANLVENDLLSEDYDKMDFELDPWGERDSSIREQFLIFLHNYQMYRNMKDFELFCYAWLNYITKPLFCREKEEDPDIGLFFQEHSESDISPNEVESILNEIGPSYPLPEKSPHLNLIENRCFQIKTLSGSKLMDRWNLDGFGVVDLVLVHKVAAIDMLGRTPLTEEILSQRDFVELLSGDEADQKRALRRLRFEPAAVYDFENDNTKLFEDLGVRLTKPTDEIKPQKVKKLRPVQRHRLAVREVAEKLWKKSPNIRIAHMIREDEIHNVYLHERDELYTDKILRKWIRDLCPNPRKGRPKNDKNSS